MIITIDIVITTYNRPERVAKFCEQIQSCNFKLQKLIVVDSSDEKNEVLSNNPSIIYKQASHKSQPYQRYVGYLCSSADVVVFFDDDLEVLNYNLFDVVAEHFYASPELVGLGLGINYKNAIAGVSEPNPKKNTLLKILKPKPKTGKMSRFGQTAGLPANNVNTEFLPGPNMCFRRKVINDLFDEKMFALFENKMGMGEDKVISYRAASKGKILYLGEEFYLYHPPIESTYFNNQMTFSAKVIYSRIWIAHQYNKISFSPFHHIYVLLFIVISLLRINSSIKLKSFCLAIKWIVQFGYCQNKINLSNINYFEHAKRDAT